MPGILVSVGRELRLAESLSQSLISTIDLLGSDRRHVAAIPGHGQIAAAVLSPAQESRHLYDDGESFMCCAGALPAPGVPWKSLMADLRGGTSIALPTVAGRFALIAWDRVTERIFLVSDSLGQQPFYLLADGTTFVASTSLATFCRTLPKVEFDPRWLHEYLAFNFALSSATPIRGVSRIAEATVTELDLRTWRTRIRQYAAHRSQAPRLLDQRETVSRAREIFGRRVPAYLADASRPAIGITSGFDSRTMLAFSAGHPGLQGFTYGVAGCDDVVSGQKIASALGLGYQSLLFDASFERELPRTMLETVFLTGGLQRINRSTLLASYRSLARSEFSPDIVISGVSGDQLFRGHGNVPSIVSPLLDSAFRSGRVDSEKLQALADGVRHPTALIDHVHTCVAELARNFGALEDPLTHLRYLTYVTPARYFSGETSIADHFFEFRSPFCDPEIVELAFSTGLSTLGLSKFANQGQPIKYRKNFLPAELIATNERLARIGIFGRPLRVFRNTGYLQYYANSAAYRIVDRARRMWRATPKTVPPLEDWDSWVKGSMASTIADYLAPGARLDAYVTRDRIEQARLRNDVYWLAKFVSAEMVLRLLDAGWDIHRTAADEIAPNVRINSPPAMRHA